MGTQNIKERHEALRTMVLNAAASTGRPIVTQVRQNGSRILVYADSHYPVDNRKARRQVERKPTS